MPNKCNDNKKRRYRVYDFLNCHLHLVQPIAGLDIVTLYLISAICLLNIDSKLKFLLITQLRLHFFILSSCPMTLG